MDRDAGKERRIAVEIMGLIQSRQVRGCVRPQERGVICLRRLPPSPILMVLAKMFCAGDHSRGLFGPYGRTIFRTTRIVENDHGAGAEEAVFPSESKSESFYLLLFLGLFAGINS